MKYKTPPHVQITETSIFEPEVLMFGNGYGYNTLNHYQCQESFKIQKGLSTTPYVITQKPFCD